MSFIYIFIILIVVLSFFLTTSYAYNKLKIRSLKECFIISFLCLSAFILVSTEVLSFFSLITRTGIGIAWGVYIILFILLNRTSDFINFLTIIYARLIGLKGYESGFYIFSFFIFLIIFVQGILYPPNNWDSMVYHLGRVIHWVQQKNVTNFPTHITRQVYQPPFAEFIALQVNLLTGDDMLSNAIQLIYMLMSVVGILYLTQILGLNKNIQLLAALFAITIPELLLQASSTQNDVVVSFFIICSSIYLLKTAKSSTRIDFIFLGIAVALAVLTKATAYIYLFPLIIIWAINLLVTKIWYRSPIVNYLLISLFIFLVLIGNTYFRNYQVSNNLLGTTKEERLTYQNQRHNPTALVSNTIRNISLHFGYPVIGGYAKKYVHKFLRLIGEDENDASLTFNSDRYKVFPFFNHEDYGANLIHLLLMIGLLLVTLKETYANKFVFFVCLAVIIQFILFCLFLKWQYWHSRLHTPMFLLYMPVLAYQFNSVFSRKLRFLGISICSLISLYAVLIVVINQSRPLFAYHPYTFNSNLSDSRYKKYFINNEKNYSIYQPVYSHIQHEKYNNIGVIADDGFWEYTLFFDTFNTVRSSHHLFVENFTKEMQNRLVEVDCIISLKQSETIAYNNVIYYRNPTFGKGLYLYEK